MNGTRYNVFGTKDYEAKEYKYISINLLGGEAVEGRGVGRIRHHKVTHRSEGRRQTHQTRGEKRK